MLNLLTFIVTYTQRGECKCGECIDAGTAPDPQGHTVDMTFFKVGLRGKDKPSAEEFQTVSAAHQGAFVDLNPLDGKAYSYTQLGGWIGDQGLAMQYMALGVMVGVFNLISPVTMGVTGSQAMELARLGFLLVQTKNTAETPSPVIR